MKNKLITNKFVLRSKCADVELSEDTFDAENYRDLLQDMYEVFTHKQNCMGLAAPQLGHKINIIMVRLTKGLVIMLNPKILTYEGKLVSGSEGCFSVPKTLNKQVQVKRHYRVKVAFTTIDGKTEIVKKFKYMDARIIQHEVDHLDGIILEETTYLQSKLNKARVYADLED